MQHLRRSFPLIVAFSFFHTAGRLMPLSRRPFAGEPMRKGRLISQSPGQSQQNIGLRSISGCLGERGWPADSIPAVQLRQPYSGLARGDIDFAMNGIEVTPTGRSPLPQPAVYTYRPQLVRERTSGGLRHWRLATADVVVGTLATPGRRAYSRNRNQVRLRRSGRAVSRPSRSGGSGCGAMDEPYRRLLRRPIPAEIRGEPQVDITSLLFRKDQEDSARD
jgi:hypothetical protein